MAAAMSLKALLSNSPTLAYHFLILLRPASLSHFWAKIILRECVRLYAISISGYSSKSISARSLCLGSLHNGHEASLSPMSLLVGQDGIDLTCGQTCLIYAQMSAHILRDYHPVLCMVCVFPDLETTDCLLV